MCYDKRLQYAKCRQEITERWQHHRAFYEINVSGSILVIANSAYAIFDNSEMTVDFHGASKSTLCLVDKTQSKAMRLINNPNLTKYLQPPSHRHLVGEISIFIVHRAFLSRDQGYYSCSYEAG